MVTITAGQLKRLAPNGRFDILQAVAEGGSTLAEYEISTPSRVCHFMAQIAHESAGFQTTEEYASGAAYEGRASLGNTRPGDGKRFKGRGLIQCTGRANYRAFTLWLREKQPDAPDFEANPTLLERFPWALLSAVWFWTTRGLNILADRDDVTRITKKINGGTNGLADRKKYVAKARQIWGSADIPVPTTDNDVRALQGDLVALGYDLKVDGESGSKTDAAVRAVQTEAGIKVDGKVGPATKAAIQKRMERRTAGGEPPRDKTIIDAIKTPEGLATAGGIVTTTVGAAANGGPMAWALAAVVVVLLVVGAGYLVRRMRREDVAA